MEHHRLSGRNALKRKTGNRAALTDTEAQFHTSSTSDCVWANHLYENFLPGGVGRKEKRKQGKKGMLSG